LHAHCSASSIDAATERLGLARDWAVLSLGSCTMYRAPCAWATFADIRRLGIAELHGLEPLPVVQLPRFVGQIAVFAMISLRRADVGNCGWRCCSGPWLLSG
jgi:hypothetical protein